MSRYGALLAPFRIKHLTLRNRIVSTAHAPGYAEDGMPKDRYQLYHAEKAKGGLALTMFGGSSTVSPECPATFGQIDVSEDRIIPYFQQFSGRIHAHGAALICQVAHMGRRTRWDSGPWLVPVAPSVVREPEHRSYPKAMEDWDIRRVVKAYGQAARRGKEGGLDGVELSFWAHHLITQFWSPSVNRRTDRYGGSLENRLRFSLEVLDAVREEVGADYIVGIRMPGDELLRNGLKPEECLEIATIMAATGKIDFINVGACQAQDWRSLSILMANMSFPVAPFLHLASAIKASTGVPVIHAHRMPDVDTALRAIADGHLDLVGMTRSHIADPHLVRKLQERRMDDIRQCVGANYCVDRLVHARDSLCIQNPSTGREQSMPHSIAKAAGRKRVVVVGGGPAGLEAARVSAERGHDVVLFESEDALGGQVNLAAKAPWRSSLAGVTRWLEGQVRKMSIDLRLGVQATDAMVRAEKPDYVVVATGGVANKGSFEGEDLTVSTWDILNGRVTPASNVLVFDSNGDHQGPSCAEFLANAGSQVEYVFPDRYAAPEIGGTNMPVHLKNLYKAKVLFTADHYLDRVYREGNRLVAVLLNDYTQEEEERLVDQVVCENGTMPRDELYFALKPHSTNLGEIDLRAVRDHRPQSVVTNPQGAFGLVRIGDAVASRNIHAAIYDALRYCKDL